MNTGWTSDAYGQGTRMSLGLTRAIVDAINEGQLREVPLKKDQVFGIAIPHTCPYVPSKVLQPIQVLPNQEDYIQARHHLAKLLIDNFKQYQADTDPSIVAAGPQLSSEFTDSQ